MRCPRCQAVGERSRVQMFPGRRAEVLADMSYDEDGDYHFHDPNVTLFSWRCSLGHVGTAETMQACPSAAKGCNWKGSVEIRADQLSFAKE